MPETIEAEVVHVEEVRSGPGPEENRGDGRQDRSETATGRDFRGFGGDWRQWKGKVLKFDSRWWPLWVILGGLLLVVLLVAGAVFAVLALVAGVLRGVWRLLFGGGVASSGGTGGGLIRR